jgi:hypothetical protein
MAASLASVLPLIPLGVSVGRNRKSSDAGLGAEGIVESPYDIFSISSIAHVDEFFESAHAEHNYDARSQTLYAIERNVSGFLLVSYGIEIRCKFVTTNALSSCEAKVYGDSP